MPLKRGGTSTVISRNIEEVLSKYKQTGKIGNVTPRNMAHAKRIASAAAYRKARGG